MKNISQKAEIGKLLEDRIGNIKRKLERSGNIGGAYLNVISPELKEFESTKKWAIIFGVDVKSYQEKVDQILSPYEQYCK